MKKIILTSVFLLALFFGSIQIASADEAGVGTAVASCSASFPGHSCMDKDSGTDCKTGYCPGSASIQCCVGGGAGIPNPLGTTNINTFAARIISYVLGLVGTISLLLFVYGGLIWMTSAGNQNAVKKGRDILVWAVIGMAVVFTAYILVKFVMQGVQGVL